MHVRILRLGLPLAIVVAPYVDSTAEGRCGRLRGPHGRGGGNVVKYGTRRVLPRAKRNPHARRTSIK